MSNNTVKTEPDAALERVRGDLAKLPPPPHGLRLQAHRPTGDFDTRNQVELVLRGDVIYKGNRPIELCQTQMVHELSDRRTLRQACAALARSWSAGFTRGEFAWPKDEGDPDDPRPVLSD